MQIFLFFLLRVINWVVSIYSWLIVINAILSWVPALYNSVLGRLINRIVDPYLSLFRRGIFAKLAYSTGIDFSPVIAILILYGIQYFATSLILKL